MDQFLNDVRFKIVNGQMTPEEGAQELESAAEAVRNRSQQPDQITLRHLWKPALLLGLLALAMGYWLYTTVRQWRERQAGQAPRPTSTVRCAGLGWCSSSVRRRRSTRSSWWCPASSPLSGARCAGMG